MRKIASPQDLQAELQRLLAYSQTEQPSREKIASELRGLAARVAKQGPKRPAEYQKRPGESDADRKKRIKEIPQSKRRKDLDAYWKLWYAHADYDDGDENMVERDRDFEEKQFGLA